MSVGQSGACNLVCRLKSLPAAAVLYFSVSLATHFRRKALLR